MIYADLNKISRVTFPLAVKGLIFLGRNTVFQYFFFSASLNPPLVQITGNPDWTTASEKMHVRDEGVTIAGLPAPIPSAPRASALLRQLLIFFYRQGSYLQRQKRHHNNLKH